MLQESGVQPEATLLYLGGGLNSYRRTQRYCYICSFRKNQDHVPRCTVASGLLSLASLIGNCFTLPLGTQGRPRKLNEACLLKHVKDLYSEGPHRTLLGFSFVDLITTLLSGYWYLL